MEPSRATKVAEKLCESGVIGIIRVRSRLDLIPAIGALRAGGLSCIEVTLNTPGALNAIREASSAYPELTLGAGTVVDCESVRQAVAAGAAFVVTPIMDPEIVTTALENECAIICGAMTPTEAYAAWKAGAHLVKIFPASVVGERFFRAMAGPLPKIRLVPTGGVTSDTTEGFLLAGAAAVCAGGWLVSEPDIRRSDYAAVTRRAEALCAAVRSARTKMGSMP